MVGEGRMIMKDGEREMTELADCTYRQAKWGTGCSGVSKPDVDDAQTKTRPKPKLTAFALSSAAIMALSLGSASLSTA